LSNDSQRFACARNHGGQIPADTHAVKAIWLARGKLPTSLKCKDDEIGMAIPQDLESVDGAGADCEKRVLELGHGADQSIAVIVQ